MFSKYFNIVLTLDKMAFEKMLNFKVVVMCLNQIPLSEPCRYQWRIFLISYALFKIFFFFLILDLHFKIFVFF